jgi:hypothetical protein
MVMGMDRPWVDARTYRREIEMVKPTVKDLIEAVEKMKEIPVHSHYIFSTEWVKPYASEDDCIKYFADNGSVVVYDSKGYAWHKGEKIDKDMCMVLI